MGMGPIWGIISLTHSSSLEQTQHVSEEMETV